MTYGKAEREPRLGCRARTFVQTHDETLSVFGRFQRIDDEVRGFDRSEWPAESVADRTVRPDERTIEAMGFAHRLRVTPASGVRIKCVAQAMHADIGGRIRRHRSAQQAEA